MDNFQKPKARKNQLVIQELTEEVLLYDLEVNKAYCLNKTAVFIWKNCDGINSVKDITLLCQAKLDKAIEEEFVWLAIAKLQSSSLLENKIPAKSMPHRREVIRKIGLGTVAALPVIAAVIAPPSALASTSCSCSNPGNCLAQTSCPNPANCNPSGICAP